MSYENDTIDVQQGFLLGLGIGVIGGIAAAVFYHKQKTIAADTVLESVKAAFLKEGPIEGSWIQLKKKPLQKFAIKSHVYLGGINRLEDSQLVQYEFIADAGTGTVIDIYRL